MGSSTAVPEASAGASYAGFEGKRRPPATRQHAGRANMHMYMCHVTDPGLSWYLEYDGGPTEYFCRSLRAPDSRPCADFIGGPSYSRL